MSIVVIMDGFEYEGWRNLSTLVEPSFNQDGLVVYYKANNNLEEIEDLLPIHNNTLIFVFPIEEATENSRIELFRHKNHIKKIARLFPYFKDTNNLVLTVDMTTSRQFKNAKKQAKKLEQIGSIDDPSFEESYFSVKELENITNKIESFKNSLDQSHNFTELDVQKFAQFKQELHTTTQDLVNSKNLAEDTAKEIKSSLEQFFTSFNTTQIEEQELNISQEIKKCLTQSFTIYKDLNDFTLIDYTYDDEINAEFYLNILSLFSIVHNSKDKLNLTYWFEIDEITNTKRDILNENMQKLMQKSISNKLAQEFTVEVNDMDNLNLNWEQIKLPPIAINDMSIPYFNSLQNKDSFQHELRGTHQDVADAIKGIKNNLIKIKQTIYNHTPNTIERKLTFEQLETEANKHLKQENYNYKDSMIEIEKSFLELKISNLISNCTSVIDKLPTLGQFLFIAPLVIVVLILLPLYLTQQLFENTALLAIIAGGYLLISWLLIFKTRKILKYYLQRYQQKLHPLMTRIKNWQHNTILKFKAVFIQKLNEENHRTYKTKLEQVSLKKSKINSHKQQLRTKQAFVQDLQNNLNLSKGNINNHKEIEIDLNKSPAEIIELSLFPNKHEVNITIDINQITKPHVYGNIESISFIKIANKGIHHD